VKKRGGAVADKRGTCGGATVKRTSKATTLDLSERNKAVSFHVELAEVQKLIKALQRGEERLKADVKQPSLGSRARLHILVKLGSGQQRFFVTGIQKARS